MIEKDRLLNVPQAAAKLNVHTSTIVRWIKSGILAAQRLPNGRLRISEADLDKLLQKEGK